MTRKLGALALGASMITRLIPHRPPMLFVDRVEGYSREPSPALRASRLLTPSEPFFAGHFPRLPIMPGALILEGLAQAAGLLLAIEGLIRDRELKGGRASDVLEALANLDLGYRLDPAFRPDASGALLLPGEATPGLLAASDLKFVAPVFPGVELFYNVRHVRDVGSLTLFEVEAETRGGGRGRGDRQAPGQGQGPTLAAKGTLSIARREYTRPLPSQE
jgi:3-hydroxymyristoyl/3-hydroxydecanoyl-(acyl carrier protein) dehydratase